MNIELLCEERPRARKHHRCYHCAGWIVPGEKHRKVTCKYDGVYSLRSHDDCEQLWTTHAADAGLRWYDLDDGIPPIRKDWGESGEFENLCNAYRGQFPGPVTRMEFHEQIAEIRWQDRLRERGLA